MTSKTHCYSSKYKSTYFICGLFFLLALISTPASAQKNYTNLCNEGFEFEKTGNLDGAIAKYTDAIISNPKNWNGYSYRAKANYKKQKFDEAIGDISQAINLSPNTTSLYEVRAECYKAKGSYDLAVTDYAFVISKTGKQDLHLYKLYYKKGQMLYNVNRYEEAISDFNQAIKLANNDPQTVGVYYDWRGTCYFKLNRFSDAIKDFETYLNPRRDDLQALFFQGLAYMKSDDSAHARTNALRMVELDPGKELYFSGDHLLDIYDTDMRRKMVKQSVDDAHALMEEEKTITSKALGNIKLADAFAKLNTAWLYSSDIDQQDKDMRRTIQKDMIDVHSRLKDKPEIPEVARKYMVQATSATGEKKYSDAIFLWNKVLAIAPYYPIAYFNKALLYEQSGDFRSSIDNMNKYLELYPDAKDARGAKDKIYEWEGKMKTQPVPPPAASIEIMQNTITPYVPQKAKFFIKGGLSMPKANTASFKTVPYTTATEAMWKTVFLEDGTIGLSQGFFAEAGLILDLVGKPSKVKFYYHPIVLGYSQNKLDWSSAGGIFSKTSIYTKPLSTFEIAQRYGISYEPVSKLLLAGYYRPAFLFPFGFEISHQAAAPDLTAFSVKSVMGTKHPMTFSHTLGFSLGYSFVTFSYESLFTKAGYDVEVKYHGATSAATGYDYKLEGRIPLHINRIGIALSF
jgi:tetratricopeptide (TPR) repeat protein